jgi:hypothetical protein
LHSVFVPCRRFPFLRPSDAEARVVCRCQLKLPSASTVSTMNLYLAVQWLEWLQSARHLPPRWMNAAVHKYTQTSSMQRRGSRLNSPRPYLTAALPAYSSSHPTLLVQEAVKTSGRRFDATLYQYDGFYSSPTNRKPPKYHFITAQTAPSLPCKPPPASSRARMRDGPHQGHHTLTWQAGFVSSFIQKQFLFPWHTPRGAEMNLSSCSANRDL